MCIRTLYCYFWYNELLLHVLYTSPELVLVNIEENNMALKLL